MHVILEILCSLFITLLLLSCSDSKEGVSSPKADNRLSQMGTDVSTEPEKLFISKDRTEEEIMTDYESLFGLIRLFQELNRKQGKTVCFIAMDWSFHSRVD